MAKAASKECKMEFYFKRENIEKLLNENPKAKGIIVKYQIKVRKTADKEMINVVEITARVDKKAAASRGAKPVPVESVPGCPEPPGCAP